jgi:nicotinamidase-related amidase
VRPMLLIIDMLNDFLDDWSTTDRASLVEGVRSLTEMFRAARQPIVWVRQEFEPDLSDAFQEMRRKNIRITCRLNRSTQHRC